MDFRSYALAAWHYRYVVVAFILVCLGIALAVNVTSPSVYQASVTLRVSPSKLGEETAQANIAGFRLLMENRRLAGAVIRKLSLDQAPYGLTGDAFVSDNLTVEDVPGSLFLRVFVRLPDPGLAARCADTLAQDAIDLNRQINEQDGQTARDFLKSEVDRARTRAERLEQEVIVQRQKAQMPLAEADADAVVSQRGELRRVVIDLEAERAHLATAEDELAKQERTYAVAPARAPGGAALLAEKVRSRNDGRPIPVAADGNAILNPVYDVLAYEVSSSRTKVAELERRRQELAAVCRVDGPQLRQMAAMYAQEIETTRREDEYHLAVTTLGVVERRFEESKLLVASRSADISVIDPAAVPRAPISPKRVRNVAVALSLGIVLGICLALLIASLAPAFASKTAGDVGQRV